jgi:hypothetical protein
MPDIQFGERTRCHIPVADSRELSDGNAAVYCGTTQFQISPLHQ